jgi:uncharacterized protein
MRQVFADSFYWVAVTHRKDQWHQRALDVSQKLGTVTLVTTDEVLTEFMAHFSAFGDVMRLHCAGGVRSMLTDTTIRVIPQSRDTFLAGLALFETRPDKSDSLTDCISMATMRAQAITEVLTHDAHFSQEGFTTLL